MVLFADNFRKVAESVRVSPVGDAEVERGRYLSFRKGDITATVRPSAIDIDYNPKWLDEPYLELKSKQYNNFGDAVGWIIYYLDMYGDGHDLPGEFEIIQESHEYFIIFGLETSLQTFHISGNGTFDVSQIPDRVDYKYERKV